MKKALSFLPPLTLLVSTVSCAEKNKTSEKSETTSRCKTVDGFRQAAIDSEAGIPYICGQDDVQVVNYEIK